MLKFNLQPDHLLKWEPYLNTSYVKVQYYFENQYTHVLGDLNTSYVKVQSTCSYSPPSLIKHLNTSYVKVQFLKILFVKA